MSTGFDGSGSSHDGDTISFTSPGVGRAGAPAETLVSSTIGDRCVNCGAVLSSDQRYCVVCGERRGAPRFALPASSVTTTETTVTSRARVPRGPRWGSGATMVAGVGTLLLALLVGFVIGNAASRNNTKTVNAATPPIRVVNVGGGGTGSAASPSTTAGTSKASTRRGASGHRAHAKAAVHKVVITKKVAGAESSAASKVLGGHNTPPATTKVGQKCSGASCSKAGFNKKTHKFDGSFFGQ